MRGFWSWGALGRRRLTAASQLPGLSCGGHDGHSALLPHGSPRHYWKQRRRERVGCAKQPCRAGHPETVLGRTAQKSTPRNSFQCVRSLLVQLGWEEGREGFSRVTGCQPGSVGGSWTCSVGQGQGCWETSPPQMSRHRLGALRDG